MTKRSSQYTGAHLNMQNNQSRQKKGSQFKHRAILHGLVGVVCFGFFMTAFGEFEQNIAAKFDVPIGTQKSLITTTTLPQNSTNLKQKHGASDFAISGNALNIALGTISINRKNKRNSTYFVPQPKFSQQEIIELAARRAKQIAELDRQAALRAAATRRAEKKLAAQKLVENKALRKAETTSEIKAKKLSPLELQSTKVTATKTASGAKQSLFIQPDAQNLRNQSSIAPKILTAKEIETLKQDSKNQAELYVAEQVAPMPTIHSGADKSQFVEAMLAQVTAQAHETEIGWSAGNGKSSTIRRQTISLDKLNGFTIVDGKIATRESKIVADRILMANVKVPVPLKRPKYIPKPKNIVLSTTRSSLTCLTTALYHEVRGESRAGQLAVAEVISARRRSKSYPNTFCGVIYQNATKRNACQFSFACDGKTDLPRDLKTWKKMKQLAADFLAGRASAPSVRGATHYHTKAVSPKWRWAMKRLGSIGAHIFYKDPRARA